MKRLLHPPGRAKLDFLLFENYHIAQNHKMDVLIIAKMLKSQGLDVAIFDIYHEDKEDIIEGIPVLHWASRALVPDDTWMLRKHTLLETIIKSMKFQWQQHRYMQEVKTFIIDKADNFYCGSYHNGMSTVLFNIQKPCYWWGLRSERFRFSLRKMLPSPFFGLHILKERSMFLRNSFQRLFVSNNIILEEHVKLGIPRDRMLIREERCIESKGSPQYDNLSQSFSLLTIGQLRPDKRVEYTIREFSQCNNEYKYVLAGTSLGSYETEISTAIDGHDNIIRINKYLEYSDFNRLISESHFVLLADKRQRGSVTNGTMMEAFINHRPIIAPNYDPYKYYVEKYDVGILYNPSMNGDLAKAINKANQLGCRHFEKQIDMFLDTLLFDKLSQLLVLDLNRKQGGECPIVAK